MIVHRNSSEHWKVTVVDTGLNTMTGGRKAYKGVYRQRAVYARHTATGVSDVNIAELVEFHKSHGKLVTMSAYNPGQRFGVL